MSQNVHRADDVESALRERQGRQIGLRQPPQPKGAAIGEPGPGDVRGVDGPASLPFEQDARSSRCRSPPRALCGSGGRGATARGRGTVSAACPGTTTDCAPPPRCWRTRPGSSSGCGPPCCTADELDQLALTDGAVGVEIVLEFLPVEFQRARHALIECYRSGPPQLARDATAIRIVAADVDRLSLRREWAADGRRSVRPPVARSRRFAAVRGLPGHRRCTPMK